MTMKTERTQIHFELTFSLSSRRPIVKSPVPRAQHAKLQPWSNSWDTNTIACKTEASSLPLPPRCNVDVMHSSFNSTQSTLLGGEGDSRNSPL